MANIFSKIAHGVVAEWNAVESEIESLRAQVDKAVPTVAPLTAALTSDVKQGASDLLGAAGVLIGDGAKPLATGIETAADAALAALTKGGAVVLDPYLNSGIDFIVAMGANSLKAWALDAKARLSAVPTSSTMTSPSPTAAPKVAASSPSPIP